MKTRLFIQAATVALVLAACSSEENTTTGANSPKLSAKGESGLTQLRTDALKSFTETFTFDARKEKVSFRTQKGVTITLDPTRLRKNGQPVSGTVTLEIATVTDLGSMVTANKTTIGLTEGEPTPDNPNTSPLVSGGEFYVDVKQEGQSLDDGAPFQLTVPTQLTTEEPDNDMVAWEGHETETGDVVWEKDTDASGQENPVPNNGGAYILNFNKFGWCNIDRFKGFQGTLVPTFVDVPAGYDDSNASVYLATDGDNLLAPFDTYDAGTELFNEHAGGGIPDGTAAHIIFVSEASGQWVYAVKDVTITAGSGPIVIDAADLITANQQDVIDFLNSLP